MKTKKHFASKLRHKIEIIYNSSISELEPENWVSMQEAYAEIAAITETNIHEFDDINFGHLMSEEYFIITMRFLKNISSKMRIKFGDRLFAIKRIVNPYQLNNILKIIALEITEK